jgi:hypothetical protein
MLTLRSTRIGWSSLFLLSFLFVGSNAGKLNAQIIDTGIQRAVGGVSIDADGLLDAAQLDALGKLAELRSAAVGKTPAELKGLAEMRKVSLRGLEEAIVECAKKQQPLPDDIKYLAGLQRIRYVFVYPEERDIVLAGPGEGWKVDGRGNVVGLSTGRPVLQLDDLLTALRSAMQASQGGIRCSIDPTQEGMARLNQLTTANPRADLKAQENALGMQQITVDGVPASSHFARILVAADYRMKRIGMGFEPAPRGVKLPSYLQMLSATSASLSTPRWWMEPKFEAIMKDPSGMAWELCGSAVGTLTQEDLFNAKGERQHSNKTNQLAKRWADMMTEAFPALAVAEPVFGELHNCMELAVVSALVVKERLPEKAGNSLPALFASTEVKTEKYYVPKQVASQASMLKKARGTVVSVSGGVAIDSWIIADKARPSEAVAAIRAKAAAKDRASWWWN